MIFWAWTQVACCRFGFCLVVACVTLQAGKSLNVRHILRNIGQLTATFEESRCSSKVRGIRRGRLNLNHCEMFMLLIEWLFVFFGD